MGLNTILARLVTTKGYERRFEHAMFEALRSGDTVWDVGANRGHYTTAFAATVGDSGRVIAYEPSPLNLEALRATVGSLRNVTVVPAALGDKTREVSFLQGLDTLGATSRIDLTNREAADRLVRVAQFTGDDMAAQAAIGVPTMVKIDTEGAELDVLSGMKIMLRDRTLRIVAVELHFALLDDRGVHDGARQIERLLVSSGFLVDWTDASHIVATRSDA